MAMPSMAMMRRPRPGSSAVADPHAAPDSANARNRSPQPVPFPFAAWIAPGPQQVGFSVIPTGSRHSRTHPVIPAKAGISSSEELLCARVAWSFPHPPRHSREGGNLPKRRAALCTGCMVIPTPTPSFPRPPRHSCRVSSFPHPPRHSREGGNLPLRDWTHRSESCRPQPSCRKRKR